MRGVLLLAGPAAAEEAQDETDFAKRVFADTLDKPTEYACFSRHYDAQHLAEHPLQKVSVMKLLIGAERDSEEQKAPLFVSGRGQFSQ